MRLQSYLQEEYLTRISQVVRRGTDKSFEVFVNPSKKELRKLKTKDGDFVVRWIADVKKEKLYVWNGDGPLHDSAWLQINSGYLKKDIRKGSVVAGIGVREGNEWVNYEGDGEMLTNEYITSLKVKEVVDFIKKLKWIDNYITFTSWVENVHRNH